MFPPVQVTLGNSFWRENSNFKKINIVFDVTASDKENKAWIVEMQRIANPYSLSCPIFYGCRAYGEQLSKSDNYNKLKKDVVIGVVNLEIWRTNPEYFHKINLTLSTDASIQLDHLIYYVIEFPKYKKLKKKKQNDQISLTRWLNLFTVDEDVIKKPMETESEIGEAYELLRTSI